MTTETTLALRTPAGLRAWRLERGLSQAQVGQLLEVTPQTVYRWESGASAIPRTVELALLYLDQPRLKDALKALR